MGLYKSLLCRRHHLQYCCELMTQHNCHTVVLTHIATVSRTVSTIKSDLWQQKSYLCKGICPGFALSNLFCSEFCLLLSCVLLFSFLLASHAHCLKLQQVDTDCVNHMHKSAIMSLSQTCKAWLSCSTISCVHRVQALVNHPIQHRVKID